MNKLILLTISAIGVAASVTASAQMPTAARYTPVSLNETAVQAIAVKHQGVVSRADLTEGANTDIRVVEGRKQHVTVSGWGFVDSDKGLMPTSFDMTSDIVYGDDGFIYLHTPLGGVRSSYVKGVPAPDGKSFTVQYPQVINTVSATDKDGVMQHYPVYAQVMQRYIEEDEYGEYATYDPCDDAARNLITYTIDEDGTVSMDPPIQNAFGIDAQGKVEAPEFLLSEYVTVPSYVIDPSLSHLPQTLWLGPGCINVKYNALPKDLLTVNVPEGLEWSNNWVAKDSRGMMYSMKIAFDGNKVYIGGLSRQNNDSDTFMGIIMGDKVVFPDRQLLGYDNANHELVYLMSAKGQWVYDPEYESSFLECSFTSEDFMMHYDAEAGIISNIEPGGALVVSASLTRPEYFFNVLYEPTFMQQDDERLNASPKAPNFIAWEDYTEKYGVYEADVRVPSTNVNGALLDTSRLYYTLFIDGEPYYFDGSNNGFAQDECLIPYTTNSYDILDQGAIKSLYVKADNPQTVSIQSYFVGTDGQTYASEMVAISVGDNAITDVNVDEAISKVFYDLKGRKVENPDKGDCLIEVMRYNNGSLKVRKVHYRK